MMNNILMPIVYVNNLKFIGIIDSLSSRNWLSSGLIFNIERQTEPFLGIVHSILQPGEYTYPIVQTFSEVNYQMLGVVKIKYSIVRHDIIRHECRWFFIINSDNELIFILNS